MDNNLRNLQLAELEILKEISKICEKHNLRWFAIDGTMLGAVRHKGFIPWDDDIDIGLPRKDYNKFLEIAEKELPHPYKVLKNYGKHNCYYAKVHNIDTTFIETSVTGFKEYYKGIFVDVMPLDGMPSDEGKRKKYLKQVGWLVKAINWHRFDFKYCKTLKSRLVYLLPEKLLYKKWYSLVTAYDFDESEYTCYAWLHNPERYVFKTEYFNERSDYLFENIYIKGARDYDGYMTAVFSNYMDLPPIDQRNNHSSGGLVDLKNSYSRYLQIHQDT